ncbi:Protein DJ-1 homolog C [Linum perenne]
MEAVITIDVLRRAGADVTVASVGKELRVEAAHGVKIIADSLVSNCVDDVFDLIALPVRLSSTVAYEICFLCITVRSRYEMDSRSFDCWRAFASCVEIEPTLLILISKLFQ